jgi:hypothetical protein
MNQDLPPVQKSLPLTGILLVILSVATLIFAGLFLWSFSQAQTATGILNKATANAAQNAAAKQKKTDTAATLAALEVPYRSYQAPVSFGSFTVNFPKSWSARVSESASNTTQVNLSVNPDFVRYRDDQAQAVALRVRLVQQNSNLFLASFADAIKSGALKKSNTTISGQNAIALTGHFHDESVSPDFVRMVAVPVRDKVIVFSCENGLYTSQFDLVLAQSKIIP